MKRPVLIVNADDYGINETMSAAIRAAFLEGIISSSTCFATSPIFEEEIRKSFGVGLKTFGVHLDLSFGNPVSQNLGHSTFPEESFKKLTKRQIKSEFTAQIQKVLKAGIQISHLDNHRDDLYWEVDKFEVVYELANQFSIPVRNPLGKNTFELSRILFYDKKYINFVEKLAAEHEKLRKSYSIKTTDYFFSLEHYRDRAFEKIEQVGELLEQEMNAIELCVHLTHSLFGDVTEKQFLSDNKLYKELFSKHRGTFVDV